MVGQFPAWLMHSKWRIDVMNSSTPHVSYTSTYSPRPWLMTVTPSWNTLCQARLHRRLFGQSLIDGLLEALKPSPAPSCNGVDSTTGQKAGGDVVLETPDALMLQRSQTDLRQKLVPSGACSSSSPSSTPNSKVAAKPPRVRILVCIWMCICACVDLYLRNAAISLGKVKIRSCYPFSSPFRQKFGLKMGEDALLQVFWAL